MENVALARKSAYLAVDQNSKRSCKKCHGWGLIGLNMRTGQPVLCGCGYKKADRPTQKISLAPPPRNHATKCASGRIRFTPEPLPDHPTVHWPAKRLAKLGLRRDRRQLHGHKVTILTNLDGSPWLPGVTVLPTA
jgi:hypothetical protein